MPSSLIFAALAAAWLVVLVPMIAKRRQEVVRIAESALASRVLNRQDAYRAALPQDQEVPMMGEAQWAPAADERRYRPGRGGYDPEAAELAARERYAFRQRVVLGLLIGVLATLVLAFASSSLFWWMHAVLDGALIGYLAYLRRQVRIEEEVRNRRAARMAGSRGLPVCPAEPLAQEAQAQRLSYEHSGPPQLRSGQSACEQEHEPPEQDEQPRGEESSDAVEPVRRPTARPAVVHPTAVVLDLDDDDPMFDELDPAFEPRYRRAVGE